MKHHASTLRKNMTDAEKVIWRGLRNRQLAGYKFRRQKPIGPYIVDFLCPEKKIIVEIDGGQHAVHVETDRQRTRYLEQKGYRVLRFWNHRVLQEQEVVLSLILSALKATPHPRPLPSRGEGVEHEALSTQTK